jgi:hypothetical protein
LRPAYILPYDDQVAHCVTKLEALQVIIQPSHHMVCKLNVCLCDQNNVLKHIKLFSSTHLL